MIKMDSNYCYLFCVFYVLSVIDVTSAIGSSSVNVDLQSSLYSCDSQFLSITIDSELIKNKFHGFDFGSKKLQTLANGLTPCFLRIGGTYADFIIFVPDGKTEQDNDKPKSMDSLAKEEYYDHCDWKEPLPKNLKNYTLTGKQWDKMMEFTSLVGWDVMFDFNLFQWRSDGLWDPTNAEELLKYSALRGYKLRAFQLGNEPNSFKHNFNFSIPAATLVKDFYTFKDILVKYPQYMNNSLYGPDVTNLNRHSSSTKYLDDFVSAGGKQVVDEISLHHYYLNGRLAKAHDFYNVAVMDSLIEEFTLGHKLAGGSRIRLTETASCYGGGAPGLSDRYVAGFLWLDKLGLAAKYGVTKVFRQTFFGELYSLISSRFDPNPDYFLSLLHKRLIEGPVFNATVHPKTKYLRVYAHCTRNSGVYKKGAVTLSYLNVKNESLPLSLGQFFDLDYDTYILTPGDSDGLKSRFVKLNGKTLQMSGSSLPPLIPVSHRGTVTLPPLSFGFLVVPDARVPLCLEYLERRK